MPLSDLLNDDAVIKQMNDYGNKYNIGSHIINNTNAFNNFMENKVNYGLAFLAGMGQTPHELQKAFNPDPINNWGPMFHMKDFSPQSSDNNMMTKAAADHPTSYLMGGLADLFLHGGHLVGYQGSDNK